MRRSPLRARRSRRRPSRSAPGGTAVVQIIARASAGAVQGDNFGFVLLRRGGDVRRIPYAFSVSRSSLTDAAVTPLKPIQSGDTRAGDDRASVYRWPTSPFSILGIFGVDPSVNEDGKEKIYSLDITKQAMNAGVVVVRPAPRLNASIALSARLEPADPPVVHGLARRERRARVRGHPGERERHAPRLPLLDRSRGRRLPAAGRYYVSVDSGRDLFTGKSLAGPYTLRSWVNDVKPPIVKVLTRDAVERAADHRREDHRREVGRRPALAAALLRAVRTAVCGRGDALRPGDRDRRLLDPARGAAAGGQAAVHAARRVRLPGGEEHQHGDETTRSRTPSSRASAPRPSTGRR